MAFASKQYICKLCVHKDENNIVWYSLRLTYLESLQATIPQKLISNQLQNNLKNLDDELLH